MSSIDSARQRFLQSPMLCDYHMHTRLTDAQGEPRDYAARAVAAGVAEIAFTDHMPFVKRFSDWHMPMEELPRYIGWIKEARREFPQVKILLGLELDHLPGIEAELRELQKRCDWDFFLGSVHFIDGWNFDGPNGAREWAGRDVDAEWERYFRLLTDAARTGLYDSMAHPDLPKKFGFRPKRDPRPMVEPFLRACAEGGVAIEISTAGLHRPCKEMYPSLAMLKVACEFGVPITFGSDAHLPAHVGRDLDKAVALAREAGYREFCRFSRRKKTLTPI